MESGWGCVSVLGLGGFVGLIIWIIRLRARIAVLEKLIASEAKPEVSAEIPRAVQLPAVSAKRPPASVELPPVVPGRRAIDWESFVGVKLFSWIALAALVVAAIFFLHHSIEQGWLRPPIGLGIGFLIGAALVAGGEWEAARRHAIAANALDAAGIAILLSTSFAMHEVWHLMPGGAAFALMALITAGALGLSIRRNSLFIATLGLLGGFSTPIFLTRVQTQPLGMFGYLLLLNGGLVWVARRKKWPWLTAASFALTSVYEVSWVLKFLTPDRLPLGIGIVIAFPLLAVFGLSADRAVRHKFFDRTAATVATLPLLFCLDLAAVPAYGRHLGLLFGFLFLVAAGLAVLSAVRGFDGLHAIGGVSTLLIFGVWLSISYDAKAWPWTLTIVSGFVLFYALFPFVRTRMRGKPEIERARVGDWTAAFLLFVFPVLAGIEPKTGSPGLLFGTLFALTLLLVARAIASDSGVLHFVSVFFAVAAETVWSARHLTPGHLLSALTLYAAFALLFLGVPLIARRLGRRLRPGGIGPGLYLTLVCHIFLLFIAAQEPLAIPPWPLFGGLALLDLAISAAALATRRPALHVSAIVASQVVLIVWLTSAWAWPWPRVAIAASIAVALYALVWRAVALRAKQEDRLYSRGAAAAILLAYLEAIAASQPPGHPGVATLAVANAVLTVLLLYLARSTGRHVLAIVGVFPVGAAAFLLHSTWLKPEMWKEELLFATPLYLLFVAYPLFLGKRAGKAIEPYLAAALAGLPYFFLARHALTSGGFSGILGALPIAQALLMVLLLWKLLAIEVPGTRAPDRIALVVGAAIAFVTVAVPLQLEKEWITMGWALLGTALAWLYSRLPHRGLLVGSFGLLAAVFVRLALNQAVWAYHPPGGIAVWNWYLYAYLVPAAAMFLAAMLLGPTEDHAFGSKLRVAWLYSAGATVLLFLLVNIDVADYYSKGPSLTFNFLSASLGQDLTYTISWTVFGITLLATGIVLRSRAARLAAILLLVVTIAKCFLHDLSRLGGLYRVASFVGLALALAFVAALLRRFALSPSSVRRREPS